MKDLAPEICRQRLVIEGNCYKVISDKDISNYLSQLSEQLDMVTLLQPVVHKSTKYGWAGWIHWETSGAHFYAWEYPKLFFSVDIYTCKPFEVDKAVEFTKNFFETNEIQFKSIEAKSGYVADTT